MTPASKCWMLKEIASIKEAPVFVQPGRYGDLILLLPAFRLWSMMVGAPVRVFTSMEFGSVLDGVSYVDPYMLDLHWMADTSRFVEIAKRMHPWVICTQLHGNGVTSVPDTFSSFSLSMWERLGMRQLYPVLPVIFDKRNYEREKVFCKRIGMETTTKPVVLYNLEGHTSPLNKKELLQDALMRLRDKFHLINVGVCRCQRVYDLLGAYERARGLVTIDTMTLHLAPATNIPYIAMTRDDNASSGSVPKGNCVLKMGYKYVPQSIKLIVDTVMSWA